MNTLVKAKPREEVSAGPPVRRGDDYFRQRLVQQPISVVEAASKIRGFSGASAKKSGNADEQAKKPEKNRFAH